METKYWKISRDCGFYTRVRVSLKRQDRNKLENRFIEFWYDSFDDENFADYIEVIMKAEWMTKEEMYDNYSKFEGWSKYILSYLYDND